VIPLKSDVFYGRLKSDLLPHSGILTVSKHLINTFYVNNALSKRALNSRSIVNSPNIVRFSSSPNDWDGIR